MGDSSEDCRSREEEIFWTHFQCIHFSQFLRGDFLHQLEIPEKFAKNIRKKLPETVTVKGPSGIIWDLGLTADGDTLFFNDGWRNFVLDHSLEENDLLIFKYNGLSHFDVLMFEGQSLCEKGSSYFVRKCVHPESENGYQNKRKIDENPDEIVHNSSRCGLESSPEKSTNNEIGTAPSRGPINTAPTNKKTRYAGSSTKSIYARHLGRKERCTFPGEVKFETEFDGAIMDEGDFSPPPTCDNGPLTQFEKANAVAKAQEALTRDGFMVVMKPTHVWRRFYMVNFIPELDREKYPFAALKLDDGVKPPPCLLSGYMQAIPVAWTAKHHLKENTDIILRINKRTWRTRYNYHKNCDCGGLSGGWKCFVNDNNLIEHDVCVFEPSNIGGKSIILDVIIIRVMDSAVQAPVPLTITHPASC